MDVKELRDLLAKRLYVELQLFKYATLRQSKEEIYKASYKIEALANLYEILIGDIDCMEEETVCVLIYQDFGILEFFYQEWLKREDSGFEELKAYIKGILENAVQANIPVFRKEWENGTKFDQAA